ncbi:hypothetical protein [Pontibacter rugosus]|uniref:SWFGD domain-containing protein n=1 Tax=Pontibacter rugosus TaxID=1745966 RepID=A0ABW3SUP8_9BACT
MNDDRRDNNRNFRRRENFQTDSDARWLHGHHQGQNSDRGNYTVDSHFNRGYGDNSFNAYGDDRSFNSNADQSQMSPQGRFQAGGAQYSGPDYTEGNNSNNPYGMTYMPNDEYNSSRHYDALADYSNDDYASPNRKSGSDYRYGLADERFGHDVRRGNNDGNWDRSSRGDYESYRRYEQGNRMYDDDYTTGFAGRNYSQGNVHYGEGAHYSEMDKWQNKPSSNYEGYMRDRDRR